MNFNMDRTESEEKATKDLQIAHHKYFAAHINYINYKNECPNPSDEEIERVNKLYAESLILRYKYNTRKITLYQVIKYRIKN